MNAWHVQRQSKECKDSASSWRNYNPKLVKEITKLQTLIKSEGDDNQKIVLRVICIKMGKF